MVVMARSHPSISMELTAVPVPNAANGSCPLEVLLAAAQHAVWCHGHVDRSELREQMRALLKDVVPAWP